MYMSSIKTFIVDFILDFTTHHLRLNYKLALKTHSHRLSGPPLNLRRTDHNQFYII